ncbi:MAG: uroporphyrinogen decarboxylase [Hydrogenobacter thermophilus]|uniref:uroporphyrinogen decarboxylase n=1 Tax=Hydrogenobacter thermophilus TaxID=940 RepID=UPI001C748AA7|nr:uroporphyrinogen decarboxylase [Hydrogenobacter thermophilus]QWK19851.1 MAG: uroporphyrinogen decarboxylase [Hydrogenobacter thermophilus]
MKDSLLLKSIRGEKIERFPVWLMRQAGRYMKEYRELREKERDFLSFCKNVELAVKVSLLPLELLDVDAVIIFSDILIPLEPMGVCIEFKEGEGPVISWDRDVKALKRISYKDTDFVNEVIKGVKEAQKDVPVIGFCGGPFTLLSYLIEGRGGKDMKDTKIFMWKQEDYHALMSLLVDNLIEYLKGQMLAGADLVQIFDSWAMYLPYEDYRDYAETYLKKLLEGIKREFNVPIIYFYRGSGSFLEVIKDLPVDVISVDWTVDMLGGMRSVHKAFQGNLDPHVLYADEETIFKKTLELLRCVPRKTRYIFNLGHGLMPDMEFNKVKFLVDAVKNFYIA